MMTCTFTKAQYSAFCIVNGKVLHTLYTLDSSNNIKEFTIMPCALMGNTMFDFTAASERPTKGEHLSTWPNSWEVSDMKA